MGSSPAVCLTCTFARPFSSIRCVSTSVFFQSTLAALIRGSPSTRRGHQLQRTPIEHSVFWQSHIARIADDAPDAEAHLQLREAIQDGGMYDRLDPSNTAMFERLWRAVSLLAYQVSITSAAFFTGKMKKKEENRHNSTFK